MTFRRKFLITLNFYNTLHNTLGILRKYILCSSFLYVLVRRVCTMQLKTTAPKFSVHLIHRRSVELQHDSKISKLIVQKNGDFPIGYTMFVFVYVFCMFVIMSDIVQISCPKMIHYSNLIHCIIIDKY